MPTRPERDRDQLATAIIDTQLLDVLAQVESLLRDAREVQRQLLRLRGVPTPASSAQQRGAVSGVQKTAAAMIDESVELTRLLRELNRDSHRLLKAR